MAEVNTNVETNEAETNEAVEVVEAQTTSRRSNKKKNVAAEYVTYGPLFYDGGRYKDPVNVIWNGVKYSIVDNDNYNKDFSCVENSCKKYLLINNNKFQMFFFFFSFV